MNLRESFSSLRRRAGVWALTGEWQDMASSRLRRDRPRVQKSQDATLDLGVRENMISAARSLCQIQGIGTAILRAYSKYTVGTCIPKWTTADEGWNDATNDAAKLWMGQCHARGKHNYRSLTDLATKSIIRDGDVLAEKMVDGGFPMFDLIEADRVTSNVSGVSIDTDDIIGGIRHDSRGRAVAYSVCERQLWGLFTKPRWVPATDILHVFKSDRIDACRGITHFSSAIEDLFDFRETTDAEKAAQKTRSKIALIVSNTLGRVNPTPWATATNGTETDSAGNTVTPELIGDAMIRYQFTGDKTEALFSNNPSDGWFKMSEMIVRLIAISLELPYEFVWNMSSLAGPGIRLTTKFADRTFQSFMDTMEDKFHFPLWSWWVNVEMDAGRIPFNPEWGTFGFTRPIMASIDAQRETTSDLAEMNAGVTSGHDICQKNNRDVYEVLEQNAREAKFILDLCARPEFEGIEPEDIRIRAATIAQMQADTAKDQAAGVVDNADKSVTPAKGQTP